MHRLAMCITCVFLPQIRGFAPSPINWVGSFLPRAITASGNCTRAPMVPVQQGLGDALGRELLQH